MSVTHSLSPLANLRDLGGIPVDGGRVRSGVVMRSDDVAVVDDASARRLVDDGLVLVIDLRSPQEADATGRGALAGYPVAYRHLPLTDHVAAPTGSLSELFTGLASDPAVAMGHWYASLLESRAPAIVDGLTAIADAPGSVLFHCAAGKDRTGVFAASLLSVLGAADDDIVADYARTSAAMPRVIERLRTQLPPDIDQQWPAEVPRVLMSAPDAAMSTMLAVTADRHGSIATLLSSTGLDDGLREKLRDRVVEA